MSKINVRGELLPIPEAARRLGLKPSTLRAWVLRRKIAYCKLNGGAVRIPGDEIERVVGEGYVPARPEAYR